MYIQFVTVDKKTRHQENNNFDQINSVKNEEKQSDIHYTGLC